MSFKKRTYQLDDAKIEKLRIQILLVLADYKNMDPKFFARIVEGNEIANRIIDNVKAVAG